MTVFDAATGMALSLNREARRILAGLGMVDSSPERLREAVVCRRGDGREVTLGDLVNAETVRAEEVEISRAYWSRYRSRNSGLPLRTRLASASRASRPQGWSCSGASTLARRIESRPNPLTSASMLSPSTTRLTWPGSRRSDGQAVCGCQNYSTRR